MGRLVGLEVENFKSYEGKQSVVGFENFTAIVGPNGSGKSNLIDALGFVFGIKPSQLRSSNLRELIYHGSQTNIKNGRIREPAIARVTGTYAKSAESREEIIFSRTIDTQGASNYYINNKKVSFSEYKDVLAKENIVVDAKNFIVFQGDIEAISLKTPKELSTFIEIISESYQYKPEYEALEQGYNRAVEQATILYNKKRVMNGETKILKQNLSTIEKYENLKKQHSDMRVLHSLWKLQVLQERASSTTRDIHQIVKDLNDISYKMRELDSSLTTKKTLHSTALKDFLKLNRVYDQKNSHFNTNKLKLASLEGQKKYLNENLNSASNSLSRAKVLYERQSQIEAGLIVDIDRLNSVINQNKSEVNSLKLKLELPLYKKIMTELNSRKSDAQLRTSSEKREFSILTADKKAILNDIQVIDSELRHILDDINSRKIIKEKLEWETNNLKSTYQTTLSKIQDTNAKLLEDISNKRKIAQREKELNEALVEIRSKIQDYIHYGEYAERLKKRSILLSSLKRAVSGVHCALSDLYEVKNKKYNLAIVIILGTLQHAIITDTQKTAFEAVQYIKEQRLGYSVFIPMSGIETWQQTEHPLALSGVRLAIDVIEFERPYLKLFKFIFKDTVICDDIETAQHCNSKGFKAVTIDGVTFHKNRTVTGGKSKSIMHNAMSLEVKQQSALFAKESEVLEKLQEIARTKFKINDNDYSLEIETSKLQASSIQEDISVLEKNVQALDTEISNFYSEYNEKKLERDKVMVKIHSLFSTLLTNFQQSNLAKDKERQIEIIKGKIKQLEDALYRDYNSEELNLIKESEESELKVQDIETTLKNLQSQLVKTQNQLKFESGRTIAMRQRYEEIKNVFEDDEKKLESVNSDVDNTNVLIRELREDLSNIKKTLSSTEHTATEYDISWRDIERKINELSAQSESTTKSLLSKEQQLERIYMEKSSILLTSQSEEIDIPLIGGELKDIPRSQIEVSYSLTEPSTEYSGTNESPKGFSYRYNNSALDSIVIDYHKLSTIQISSNEDEQECFFSNKLSELSNEMNLLSPNIKFSNKLDGYINQLATIDKELSAKQKEANDVKERFLTVKALRTEKFMKAFKHVTQVIESIYNELTKTRSAPIGGSACLILQSPDNPIEGGIKYHVMPPTKRFRDMELLSGGEKTVASLALLFAIHSYKPSPIFLLDEIDAALDKHNVVRVANYISKNASDSLQFIVISLKNFFYETADALVGVYRESSANSSMILTLKLKGYYH